MRTLDQYKAEQMNNAEFAKAYEELQPELQIIRALVDARNTRHLTQQALADKTGIAQAEISRLENGMRNPSIKLLKRLADGMDMRLQISFVPKES